MALYKPFKRLKTTGKTLTSRELYIARGARHKIYLIVYTAKTVVLKLHHRFNRGPHHAFYTGVKLTPVQHPVVLF